MPGVVSAGAVTGLAGSLVVLAWGLAAAFAASGLVVGCRTHGDLPFDSATSGDAVYVAQVDVDGATAWAQAKATLSNLSLRPVLSLIHIPAPTRPSPIT